MLERLPARKAELFHLLAQAVALPWMDEEGQRSTLVRWSADAEDAPAQVATPAQLAMMGIGFEVQAPTDNEVTG